MIRNSRPEIDVFETAMTRNPVAVRRTPADRHHPDRQIAEEFQSLKHKGKSLYMYVCASLTTPRHLIDYDMMR